MIQLDVTELTDHDGVLINVTGKIDTQGTETLREQVREHLDDLNVKHIVVSLADCDFITSVGLGMLVGAHKKANGLGKKLHFIQLHKNIESIFRITNLYSFFNVSETLEQVWGG